MQIYFLIFTHMLQYGLIYICAHTNEEIFKNNKNKNVPLILHCKAFFWGGDHLSVCFFKIVETRTS